MRLEQWIYTIPLRLRSLFRRQRVEQELDEELQFHLESQFALQAGKGLDPAEAMRAARQITGPLAQIKEECRDMRKLNLLENLLQDIRYAGRTFAKSPLFTATAVLTLALGIGSNTAIFSLMDAVLLKSLPVSNPEELVMFTPVSREGKLGSGFSYPAYQDLSRAGDVFRGLLGASSLRRVEVTNGNGTEAARCKIVTDGYFSLLGVHPRLGRLFQANDDRQPVAVLSARYWKRAYGESPAALGKQLIVDGLPVTVVGVVADSFTGEAVGEVPDLFATVSLETAQRRESQGFVWLNLMARLSPGRTPEQGAAALKVILSRSNGEIADRIAVDPGGRGFSWLRDRFSESLRILMAVVAVVLLIACSNLANLLLARAASRQHEIATRLAIGAGRARIVRQLLTESLLLAGMGGVLGVLFAIWSGRLLLAMLVSGPNAAALDLGPDLRTLLFTAAVSLLTGILFGLAPALQAVRHDLGATLKRGARGMAGYENRWRLKDALTVAQIGLSLLLLVTGGLCVRTLQNLKNVDTGVRAENVLAIEIGVERGYRPDFPALLVRLLERVRAIPGVQSASVSFNGTLSDAGGGVGGLMIPGFTPRNSEDQRARADWVGPDYFATVGIPVVEGREFTVAEAGMSPKVVVVNQTMARFYFGTSSAVGRRFEFNKDSYEIVGVARDSKYIDLRAPSPRVIYFAALQRRGGVNSLELRTADSPTALAATVRNVIREVDSHLRTRDIRTVAERIDAKLGRERMVANLAAFFGGLTLLLVSIGIYGTLAYSVAQRTNEIGIRMALGAAPGSILKLVLRDIVARLAMGLALGAAAVLFATRTLAAILFGVTPTDTVTIAGAALTLAAVALAASYIPALRASRVDPLTALRLD